MRLLLDTCALLWFLTNDSSLSGMARTAIENPANERWLSPISLLEIALKVRLGKLTLHAPFGALFPAHLLANDIHLLPLETAHIEPLTTLPLHHRDPFDRLLAATALMEGLTLISSDTAFDGSKSTRKWAQSHGICIDDSVPPVADYNEPCSRTAEEVAVRTIILHCLAAVGHDVDPGPVLDWLREEGIWKFVSTKEQAFLRARTRSAKKKSDARWRQEAQWALLWAISKIESLGLPTRCCDTARLVDEIMPDLGDAIHPFVSTARLRSPGHILAEEDRVYNLHCYARQAHRRGEMPADLVYDVLYQRHYAFEWLTGDEDWDEVTTDT